jgi:hypothetical protein
MDNIMGDEIAGITVNVYMNNQVGKFVLIQTSTTDNKGWIYITN